LVGGCVLLIVRVRGVEPPALAPGARALIIGSFAVLCVAVYLGTIVTGSGPHAGDLDAPRHGLDPHLWSHIHAWSVYVLVALTVVTIVALWRTGAPRSITVATWWLLVAELAQGLIGFVQYF